MVKYTKDKYGAEMCEVTCKCNTIMRLLSQDEGDECTYWCPRCGALFKAYSAFEDTTYSDPDAWSIPKK